MGNCVGRVYRLDGRDWRCVVQWASTKVLSRAPVCQQCGRIARPCSCSPTYEFLRTFLVIRNVLIERVRWDEDADDGWVLVEPREWMIRPLRGMRRVRP